MSRLNCLIGTVLIPASLAWASDPGLDLERAVKLALERNERARTAELQSEAARARVAKARAFFLPDLTVTANYTYRPEEVNRTVGGEEVTIQRHNALSQLAVFNLTVFDARAWPLYGQVKKEREAVRLSSADDKRRLGFEAANAFLMTLSMEQVLEAARRRLDFARKSLADARARFAAQLASSNDVTRTDLELATAERELARAQGNLETAYLRLGDLLDTPVRGPLVPPVDLLQVAAQPAADSAGLIAGARQGRLDIAASQWHARALQDAAQEPLMRLLPSLGVTGQYRLTNEGGLSGREEDWFLGANLNWSLYDGGERWADRAERRALARAAQLQAQALARHVEVQVRTALVTLTSTQAASRQAQVAVEVARQNAEQTSELYRQSLTSALAVADANVNRFEAEVALAREQYGVALAYLDLRAALGLDPVGKELVP